MKTEITINMNAKFGSFLSNGTLASSFCTEEILPAIEKNNIIILNMEGIENMTDSFGNALIANLIRKIGNKFFESVKFSNCSDIIKTLILLAVRFGKILESQDSQ